MNESDKDKPGVIAIPPHIYLMFLLTGQALAGLGEEPPSQEGKP